MPGSDDAEDEQPHQQTRDPCEEPERGSAGTRGGHTVPYVFGTGHSSHIVQLHARESHASNERRSSILHPERDRSRSAEVTQIRAQLISNTDRLNHFSDNRSLLDVSKHARHKSMIKDISDFSEHELIEELARRRQFTSEQILFQLNHMTLQTGRDEPTALPYFVSEGKVIDPISRLTFIPTPMFLWDDRQQDPDKVATLKHVAVEDVKELFKMNALDFCLAAYAPYRSQRLLYSGHIKKADPTLYNRLKVFANRSGTYMGAADMFKRNGIVVPEDFNAYNLSTPLVTLQYANALLLNAAHSEGYIKKFGLKGQPQLG